MCGDNASTYTVPAGAAAVDIVAAGGQGGTGMVAGNEDSDASGSVGGTVTETVPVSPGEKLYVRVGGAGNDVRAGGVGGGGSGGGTTSCEHGDAAGGGGSTTPDCS